MRCRIDLRLVTFMTVALFFTSLFTGCMSSGVRSSGAMLPQSPEVTADTFLKMSVQHDCSKGWCDGFQVRLENLTDAPIDILPHQSKILRAAQNFPIGVEGEDPKKEFTVPALGQLKLKMFAFDPTVGSQPLQYPKPEQVWCSLKVDSACRNPSQGEAMCAGFARAYYESYLSADGWITVKMAYRSSKTVAYLSTDKPTIIGEKPAAQVAENSNAPWWHGSGSESVFQKVECDEKCRCNVLTPRRNFFLDDKFKLAN